MNKTNNLFCIREAIIIPPKSLQIPTGKKILIALSILTTLGFVIFKSYSAIKNKIFHINTKKTDNTESDQAKLSTPPKRELTQITEDEKYENAIQLNQELKLKAENLEIEITQILTKKNQELKSKIQNLENQIIQESQKIDLIQKNQQLSLRIKDLEKEIQDEKERQEEFQRNEKNSEAQKRKTIERVNALYEPEDSKPSHPKEFTDNALIDTATHAVSSAVSSYLTSFYSLKDE